MSLSSFITDLLEISLAFLLISIVFSLILFAGFKFFKINKIHFKWLLEKGLWLINGLPVFLIVLAVLAALFNS